MWKDFNTFILLKAGVNFSSWRNKIVGIMFFKCVTIIGGGMVKAGVGFSIGQGFINIF